MEYVIAAIFAVVAAISYLKSYFALRVCFRLNNKMIYKRVNQRVALHISSGEYHIYPGYETLVFLTLGVVFTAFCVAAV